MSAPARAGRWLAHARALGFGAALGLALSLTGFADWREAHRMFVFADLRLLFTFAGALAISLVGYRLLGRRGRFEDVPLHPGVVPGSVLFGIGWALTGACPAIVFVQLGEGRLAALATLAGMLLGMRVYRPIHARWFRWERGSCSS